VKDKERYLKEKDADPDAAAKKKTGNTSKFNF
jgi:hypothetical protein